LQVLVLNKDERDRDYYDYSFIFAKKKAGNPTTTSDLMNTLFLGNLVSSSLCVKTFLD